MVKKEIETIKIFDKMNYDKETKDILWKIHLQLGLNFTTLVILHENQKKENSFFLEKVNMFIGNPIFCNSIKMAEDFIRNHNPLDIPEIGINGVKREGED